MLKYPPLRLKYKKKQNLMLKSRILLPIIWDKSTVQFFKSIKTCIFYLYYRYDYRFTIQNWYFS